ncbi:MAG: Crp/Fnr family transcriptional regulator [bacterium]|nr:Crp/Fnr family transcriptional regulator [bacterium]
MEVTFSKLVRFFTKYRKLHFKKSEVILRSEDSPRGVFFLSRGYVRAYSISSEGDELTLIIFKKGDFFPIIWAFNETPVSFYLEAMTPVEVWLAPKEDFLKFVQANGDVLLELTRRILTRMGGLLARMEYLVFGNAYNQVASIVLICAERFGKNGGKNILIDVPLTHKQIADLVGVSRETASIELKKLERKGFIGYEGKHIMVKNMEKLKEESLLHESF